MPRFHRLFLTGYPLHVVQRGHDRKPVFDGDADYRYYLDNLREQKGLLDIKIYAFCLMTNHVHIVLQPDSEPGSVSKLMRVLAARQTRRINKARKRSGTLWEGRFKASLIDTDSYLLACCRYVDLNPIRARLVDAPECYQWSSFRSRTGLQPISWLDFDTAYQSLGNSPKSRASRYSRFVAEGIGESEMDLIRQAVRRNQLTGSKHFVDAIVEKTHRRISTRGQGRPAKPNPSREK